VERVTVARFGSRTGCANIENRSGRVHPRGVDDAPSFGFVRVAQQDSRHRLLTPAPSERGQDVDRMAIETRLQRNVGFLFVAILTITLFGFFPSYFSKFPTFEGFGWPHHFHAVIALVWICMLITQAFLIRAKQYRLHRTVGQASYVVIPLLLLSFFLMARAQYQRNTLVNHLTEADAVAALSRNGIPELVFIAILYTLGIVYRKRPAWHLRFFTGIALVMLGPGLGRLAFGNFPPHVAGPILGLMFLGLPVIWLIVDVVRKRSPVPLLTYIAITITAVVLPGQGHAGWWQGFAGFLARTFF